MKEENNNMEGKENNKIELSYTTEDDEDEINYQQLFANFASNTTAHGFGQITLTQNIPIKVFWILTLLACHIVLYFQITPLVEQYSRKPTSTKIYLQDETSTYFPVIVLCNENAIKLEKLGSLEALLNNKTVNSKSANSTQIVVQNRTQYSYRIYDDYGNFTEHYYYVNDSLTVEDEFFTQTEFKKKYKSSIDALVLLDKDELFEYGTSLDEMVVSCQWKFKECLSNEAGAFWHKFWHWKYGTCHVFNSGLSQNGTEEDILSVSSPGPDNALSLTLFINQSQYNPNVTDAAGIRFYIGDQGKLYSPYAQGHSLSPGSSYFVGVRKRNIIRVDPFQNDTCKKHHKTNLQNPVTQNVLTKYSKELCKYLCLAETQLYYCGCIEYYLPKTVSENETCTSESQRLCTAKPHENFTIANAECITKCTPPCNEISYSTQISMQKYPNLKYEEVDSNKLFSVQKGDIDYLKVTFYYETMETEVWEDEEVYGIVNLLADIGGQLGLFSGYSVFTMIEFLFFFFYIGAHTVYFIIPRRRIAYQG
ncbi:degenerin mec-4-like [Hydractinia symbiolongicarpus]|uniref:degenerin mec-4-like n=1 Tax=Hydractinia symbiolongicarpus TaxID=13093 RepID=UPI00254C6D1D|nr:degenerin mec-4-like [Hydractinia symbiolongicarpus]